MSEEAIDEETTLAQVTVDTGTQEHHASIMRRGTKPDQSYHVLFEGREVEIVNKNDDTSAIVLGITQIGLLVGKTLDK